MDRDFKGIWIPKEIWMSDKLTLQEKIFFVEIDSLDNSSWCFASNAYFAEFFWISKTRVSLVIKSLVDKKYITLKLIYKEGTQQILKRVLKVCYIPSLTKVKDPIQQKLKDNNTVNNTVNNKDTSKEVSKEVDVIAGTEKEKQTKEKKSSFKWGESLADVKKELGIFINHWNVIYKQNRKITDELKKAYIVVRKKYFKDDFSTAYQAYNLKKKWVEKQFLLTPIWFVTQRLNWFTSYL